MLHILTDFQALDPGNALFRNWIEENRKEGHNLVVDASGAKGHVSRFLAGEFPELTFEIQDVSQALLTKAQQALSPALQKRIKFNQHDKFEPQPIPDTDKVLAYVLKNVLWNRSDEESIRILQAFIPALEKSPQTVILLNDGISPVRGMFESHVEEAYRRRDVTVMTMHNNKQRTEQEWRELFTKASPQFQVRVHRRLLEILCIVY